MNLFIKYRLFRLVDKSLMKILRDFKSRKIREDNYKRNKDLRLKYLNALNIS